MTIIFDPVDPDNPDHVWMLYQLLRERTPEQSISHKKMPTLIEHQQFIDSNPYKAWYIIKDADHYVGATYVTWKREIGLFLFKAYWGRTYGYAAVSAVQALHPGKLYANVAILNGPAQNFWRKLGFKPVQITYEL